MKFVKRKGESLSFFAGQIKAKELRELSLDEILKTIDIAIRVAKDKMYEIKNRKEREDLKLYLAYLSKEIAGFLEETIKTDLEEEAKM
jgi:hypothetical protein